MPGGGDDTYRFYELQRPPRVLREAGGQVDELTVTGWRPAPWLRCSIPPRRCATPWKRRLVARADCVEASEFERRCRRRMVTPGMREDAKATPMARWWLVHDWVAAPLPYAAPRLVEAEQRQDGEAAFAEAVRETTGAARDELLEQARDGYRALEARVAAIEARAATFEGYAAAVAGLGAVGAALLGADEDFSGFADWVVATALGVALICIVLSGYRAFQAAARRHDWPRPYEPEPTLARAGEPADDDRKILLIAALLLAIARGELLADWKLERFKQASRYFSLGLAAVLVAASVLVLW
jgi:hypothetical protein